MPSLHPMKLHSQQTRLIKLALGVCFVIATASGISFWLAGNDSTNFGSSRFSLSSLFPPQPFAGVSHGGCSRYHLPYNQIDTVAVTRFSNEQLVMMPSTYWKYEDGQARVTFSKAPSPCRGASCGTPEPNQSSQMSTVPNLGVYRIISQIGVLSHKMIIDDSRAVSTTEEPDFRYSSRSYSPLLRPPSFGGLFA